MISNNKKNQNKVFDRSTPSMKKVDDGEKKKEKKEKRKKRMAFLVATTSLPAVYRPNGYARTTTAGTPHARAKKEKIMTFIVATNVIASRPPERRPTGTPHARAN